MVGQLITLPVRFGVRATRLWLRAAEETVNIAVSATGHLIGRASRGAHDSARAHPSSAQSNGRSAPDLDAELEAERRDQRREQTGTIDEFSSPARPTAQPTTRPVAPPGAPEPPTEREPVHVSEEPDLVEEFAEPGAEDGAGAEIHVGEPWEGYGEMNAKQIVARLGPATPAELAAVQLYESTHRRRQTVLNAVQRELRTANGRSSGSQQRG